MLQVVHSEVKSFVCNLFLGDMNMLGQGVPEDKTEAIMCYERAIELGNYT